MREAIAVACISLNSFTEVSSGGDGSVSARSSVHRSSSSGFDIDGGVALEEKRDVKVAFVAAKDGALFEGIGRIEEGTRDASTPGVDMPDLTLAVLCKLMMDGVVEPLLSFPPATPDSLATSGVFAFAMLCDTCALMCAAAPEIHEPRAFTRLPSSVKFEPLLRCDRGRVSPVKPISPTSFNTSN